MTIAVDEFYENRHASAHDVCGKRNRRRAGDAQDVSANVYAVVWALTDPGSVKAMGTKRMLWSQLRRARRVRA
jgi:hypothetical protein